MRRPVIVVCLVLVVLLAVAGGAVYTASVLGSTDGPAVTLARPAPAAASSEPRKLIGQPQLRDLGYQRREDTRRFKPPYLLLCGSDSCDGGGAATGAITTPKSVEAVDAVMTLTVQLKTSPGDSAFIEAVHRRRGVWKKSRPMRPRGYSRVVAERRSTTTLTWVRKNLPARGSRYGFDIGIYPASYRAPPRPAKLWLYSTSVVVELSPSDDTK